jgi:hypothetical protein
VRQTDSKQLADSAVAQHQHTFFRHAEDWKRRYAMGRNVTPKAHCLPQIYRFPNKIARIASTKTTSNIVKLVNACDLEAFVLALSFCLLTVQLV